MLQKIFSDATNIVSNEMAATLLSFSVVFCLVLAALWAVVGVYPGRQNDRATLPAKADDKRSRN